MHLRCLSFQSKIIFLEMIYTTHYLETLQLTKLLKIKKFKKKIKVKFVTSAIMNQLSYHVSQKKLNKEGLILKSDIEKDIQETIKLLRNI